MFKLSSRYLLPLTMLICLCLGAASQTIKRKFVINGLIKNISPIPEKLYLMETGRGLLKAERLTAEVKSGKYRFESDLAEDELTQVFISDDSIAVKDQIFTKNCFDLIIDAGNINITSDGNLSNFTTSGSGAIYQKQYQQFEKIINTKTKEVLAGDGFGEVNYKNLTKLSGPASTKMIEVGRYYSNILYNYIKEKPGTKLSNYFTGHLVSQVYFETLKKDTLYQLLPEKVRSKKIGQLMLKSNSWRMKIGSVIKDVTLVDTTNNRILLSSALSKGKYTLLNFWASWCTPCREEHPGLISLYNDYKDLGFNIIGITIDGAVTKAAWKDAIVKDRLPWQQLSDIAGGWGSQLFQIQYRISDLPRNFLLDSNGKIIAENLTAQSLKAKLKEILKRKI